MGFWWLGLWVSQMAPKAWLERWRGPTYSSSDVLLVDTEIFGIAPSWAKPQQTNTTTNFA